MYLEHIMASNSVDHEDIQYKINSEESKYHKEYDNFANENLI